MFYKQCWKKKFSVFLCCGMLLAACQGLSVHPLYQTGSVNKSTRVKLASIVIDPTQDSVVQPLRNRLIFLFTNGRSVPQNPQYHLALNVRYYTEYQAPVDIGDVTERVGRAAIGVVNMQSDYQLRNQKGQVVAQGHRFVRVSFDRPYREYASLQAEKNAQQTAAHSLADDILLSLAQNLSSK